MIERHNPNAGPSTSACLARMKRARLETNGTNRDAIEHILAHGKDYRARHNAAVNAAGRRQAYRDLGMTRVRGANGGVYYE